MQAKHQISKLRLIPCACAHLSPRARAINQTGESLMTATPNSRTGRMRAIAIACLAASLASACGRNDRAASLAFPHDKPIGHNIATENQTGGGLRANGGNVETGRRPEVLFGSGPGDQRAQRSHFTPHRQLRQLVPVVWPKGRSPQRDADEVWSALRHRKAHVVRIGLARESDLSSRWYLSRTHYAQHALTVQSDDAPSTWAGGGSYADRHYSCHADRGSSHHQTLGRSRYVCDPDEGGHIPINQQGVRQGVGTGDQDDSDQP